MTTSPVAPVRRTQLSSAARCRRDDRGVATAEYAVATAAGCGLAAVLIKLLTSDWGQTLLKTLFDMIFKAIGLA